MKAKTSWTDVRILNGKLKLPLDFTLKKVGIKPYVVEKYMSGEIEPKHPTCEKIHEYLCSVRSKRAEFYNTIA